MGAGSGTSLSNPPLPCSTEVFICTSPLRKYHHCVGEKVRCPASPRQSVLSLRFYNKPAETQEGVGGGGRAAASLKGCRPAPPHTYLLPGPELRGPSRPADRPVPLTVSLGGEAPGAPVRGAHYPDQGQDSGLGGPAH